MKNLDVWYSHLDIEPLVQEFASQFKHKIVKRAEKELAKARTKDSMAAFSKLTHEVDGQARIVDQSPLIVPIEQLAPGDEREEMFEALRELDARLPRDARVRPADSVRGVRADRFRSQGGRGRQRRHARVDRAADRA